MLAAAAELEALEFAAAADARRITELEAQLQAATAKPLTGPGSGTTKFGQRPPAAPVVPSTTTTKETTP